MIFGPRWLPIKMEQGTGSREEKKALGGESGEGEALVALDWLGQWRRLELPERKETTLSQRLTARGARVGWREAACVRV